MSPFAKAALVSLVLMLAGAAALPAAPPTREEIKKAITDLESESFQVRQKASAYLRAAGRAAEPYLVEAQKGAGLEVSNRIGTILLEFKWGIYPDTPKEVLEQIQRYRAGEGAARLGAIGELMKHGGPGLAALLKIARAEENPGLRREIYLLAARETVTTVPRLLVEGNDNLAEELLELSLASPDETAPRHYAAFLLLRGRLDEKITQYKKRAAVEGADASLVLAQFYRAKGDLAAARAASDPFIVVSKLHEEQGDWTALARLVKPMKQVPDSLAICAAYQRLAGDAASADQTLRQLLEFGEADTTDTFQSRVAAKGLFLNDRPGAALALLIRKKQYLPAFEVLAAQSRYREAFELLDKIDKDEEHPFRTLELRRAQFLYQLGERDKAEAILIKTSEELQTDGAFLGYRGLIRTEQRLGLTEQAYAHAAAGLAKGWDEERGADLLKHFFPDQGAAAEIWWTFFRKKYTTEKPAETMRRLRDIFEKRTAPKNFEELVRDLDQASLAEDDLMRHRAVGAIAGACMVLGLDDLELKYLRTLARLLEKPAAYVRWGDLLARKKQFKEAAEQYQKAWELDRTLPLPIYLRGGALAQAGNTDEGRKLMELAQVIPLASDELRYGLARGLAGRGDADGARKSRALVLRLGANTSWESNEVLRLLGYEAMRRGEHAHAADLFERYRLHCLPAETTFVEYGAYVHVPALVHLNRARAFAAAGKFDEARKAAELALTLTPGNINVPIQLVPVLDKAERKADADALFSQVLAVHEKLCGEFPRSAVQHNSAAWMCAACQRELDKGLAHAEKAVTLEPKHAGYLDTLAEVHFQRGGKEKAIELMKRCQELEPANEYFKRQRHRFEAGDPKVPVPEAGS